MTDSTSVMRWVRTGDYLDALQFPPLKWAVQGIIPEGFGLVTGAPKIGKSWMVLGVGLAVSQGRPALGHVSTGTPRPVLYLALVDGERRLQDRCRQLLGENAPIPANLHYVTQVPSHDVLHVIDEWLTEHGPAAPLVVLDTLGRVMPPALPGESAYQRDYRIGSALKAYSDRYPGTTLAVVHHVRKAVGDDWMDSTSGTNGLNGAADWTLNVGRPRNEVAGLLRVTGRDVSEGEYAVTCSYGAWTLDGADLPEASTNARRRAATSGVGDVAVAIIELLRAHPEGLGPTNVARAVGIEPKHAGMYLTRLTESGRIRKAGRGIYTCVESVESVESDGQGQVFIPTTDKECGSVRLLDSPFSTLSTVSMPPVAASC